LEIDGGWGEAAPLEPYDGVSVERCRAALDAYLPILREADPSVPGVRVVDACRAADPLPQALAAVDLAFWDRAGRQAGKPVCELLTDAPEAFVRVNALADTAAGAAEALLAKAAFCHAVGEEVYVASTLDGPLGIAASVHCAAALRIARPCGLATLDRLDGVDPGALAPVGGMLEVPRSPGLGATPEQFLR